MQRERPRCSSRVCLFNALRTGRRNSGSGRRLETHRNDKNTRENVVDHLQVVMYRVYKTEEQRVVFIWSVQPD